jgi:hypothetical protein
MKKFKDFLDANPVRVAGFVSSAVAIVVAFLFPETPTEAAVAFVLSALGLGEYAQRKEDQKTEDALLTDPEDIEL